MPDVVLTSATVDLAGRRVRAGDDTVRDLTLLEARLLEYLVARPGVDIAREQLLVDVWGHRPTMQTRTVDNVVRKLRQKLSETAGSPRHLVTCSGGYRFEALSARRSVGVPLDGSFGREDLRRTVVAQLAARRWVALVGMAGAGKSRLAREVLRELDRPCVWVDAGDASTPEALAERIGEALQLGAGGARPPLTEALARAPDTVIVLDGVDGVTPSLRAALQGWAEADAEIRWLVTARLAPGLRGELPLEVGPLSLEAACALFRDRSGGQPADDAVVRAIVDRLDRLPQAVELAAARSALLGPRELLARLDAEPWEPIDAALAVSWDRLDPEVRAALIACTVLTGTFTPAAAAAVIGGAALPQLEALHSAGLIRTLHDPRRGGHRRLEILSSVRRFVSRRGAPDAATRARLRAFAVASTGRCLFVPERLAPERDLLEVALRSALVEGTDDEVEEIAIRLDRALVLTGNRQDHERILTSALRHSARTEASSGLHYVASIHAFLCGDVAASWRHAARSEEVARTEADRAAADARTGTLFALKSDLPAARLRLESALRRYEAIDDPEGIVHTLHELARVVGRMDEPRAFDQLVGRALDLVARIPDAPRLTAMVEVAAAVADANRRPGVALARQERAARIFADLGDVVNEMNTRFRAANSCIYLGLDGPAEQHLRAAWTLAQAHGLTAFLPSGAIAANLALVRLMQGDLPGGGEWMARCRAAHARSGLDYGRGLVATHDAMVDLLAGRPDAAAAGLAGVEQGPEDAAIGSVGALRAVAEAMLGRGDAARVVELSDAGVSSILVAHVQAHLNLDATLLGTPEPLETTSRVLRRLLELRVARGR